MVTTGMGSGVAVNRENGDSTYMKMGLGGLNVGYGAQFYQVVFLFPSYASLMHFIDSGWDVGAEADAVGGKDSEGIALRLPDGTLVYELNEKGVMLSGALTGTKYWKWDELNQ